MRTFIALELPHRLQNTLADMQKCFGTAQYGIRWVRPGNIHLTLKFLGATPEDKQEQICMTLDSAASDCKPLVLDVSGVSAFPNTRNPKVIWAGVTTSPEMTVLQQRLDEGLGSLGFAPEKRPFAPHLTLGRVKDIRIRRALRPVMEQLSGQHIGTCEASRLIFFKSDLKPDGPVYSVLKAVRL